MKEPKITIRRLINWLREQPRRKRYDYLDNRNCLYCQFLRARGFENENIHAGGSTVSVGNHVIVLGPKLEGIPHQTPWTFGAALKRAEALL